MATIDKVCKEEANSFILFDPDIVKGLFRRGLIYFDVPVYQDDRFKGKQSIFKYMFILWVRCQTSLFNLVFFCKIFFWTDT